MPVKSGLIPRYTDEHVCAVCSLTELVADGNNYCNACRNYLCLACTKRHGVQCVNKAKNTVTGAVPAKRTSQVVRRTVYTLSNHDTHLPIATDCNVRNRMSDGAIGSRPQLNASVNGSGSSGRHYSATGGVVSVGRGAENGHDNPLLWCSLHPQHNIENYCVEHDWLCCEICLTEVHNKCTVQPVDEVAHDIRVNKRMAEIVQEIETIRRDCERAVLELTTKIKALTAGEILDKTVEEIGTDSGEMRNAMLDEWKRTSERNITTCKHIQTSIDVCLREIRNALENGNDVMTFVALKRNQRLTVRCKRELYQLIEDELRGPVPLNANTWISVEETQDLDRDNANDDPHDKRKSSECDSGKETKTLGSNNACFVKKSTSLNKENEESRELDCESKIIKDDATEIVVCRLGNKRGNTFKYSHYDPISNTSTGKEIDKLQNTLNSGDDCNIDLNVNGHKMGKENDSVTNLGSSRSSSGDSRKNVAFPKPPKSTVRQTSKRSVGGTIHKYGLVTEYYLNEITDDEDHTILRLKSAPPTMIETRASTTTRSDRPKSTIETTQRKLVISEQRVLSEKKSEKIAPIVPSVTESREIKPRALSASERNSQREMLWKNSHDNEAISFEKGKKSRHRKKLRSIIKKDKSRGRSRSASAERQMTGSISVPPSANTVDTTHTKPLTAEAVPLVMKEATYIKAPDPDRRKSSGRCRPIEEEEFQYNSQLYARQPRSKLVLKDEQIIRFSQDENMCQISGITCMPDGRIVVSDFNNKSIKMFRTGWGKASVLYLEDPPHGVTAVSNATLAAINGLAFDRMLIITVGHELYVRSRFKTGCMCRAITSYNSHIYMLCVCNYKTEVRILNTDGVVNIRLNLGHLVADPIDIAVNPLSGVMYVTDKTKGVNVIKTGRVVQKTVDRNIEGYHGVTVDLSNNVFICTQRPGGIHEISYDGKYLMPVLIGYAVEDAQQVCYNTAYNTLIVACGRSETIQIYQMFDQLVFKRT